MMERAFRLSPGAPPLYFYNRLRVAYLYGDYQTAVAAARQSPNTPLTQMFLAMSLARLGRQDDADAVVKDLRSTSPEFDPAAVCNVPWLLDPRAQADVIAGLKEIGLYSGAPGPEDRKTRRAPQGYFHAEFHGRRPGGAG